MSDTDHGGHGAAATHDSGHDAGHGGDAHGGDAGHGHDAHGGDGLGPIDWPMWLTGLLGVVAALVVVAAFVASVGSPLAL
ncbi:MAG TPA: hypothetical protein VMU14_16515 [Acidimicrobiales bacterium]|nr:hypothetical protein [Acidimicrobiales bacterium]